MPILYILYGGSSVDGAGPGKYEGWTFNKNRALSHFKEVQSSPYNTGCVKILTDDTERRAMSESDFN